MVTILIVDDDPKLLDMLRRALSYEGFRVLSATNGNEALAELRARRPDVVILDWFMPGLDGLSSARQRADSGGGVSFGPGLYALRSAAVERGLGNHLEV